MVRKGSRSSCVSERYGHCNCQLGFKVRMANPDPAGEGQQMLAEHIQVGKQR